MNDRERLTGCWELVSYTLLTAGDAILHPMGQSPQGILFYGPGGHLSVHLMQPGAQPPANNTLPAGVSPDLALSYACYSSYFGHYQVDEQARQVTHFVAGASVLSWAGEAFTRHYTLSTSLNNGLSTSRGDTCGEDQLTLTADANEKGYTPILLWQRAGKAA